MNKKHTEKMKRKRELKAQRRAKYLALAGTSKRHKRQVRRSPVAGTYKHAHVMISCGNPGCQKCHPRPTNQQIILKLKQEK